MSQTLPSAAEACLADLAAHLPPAALLTGADVPARNLQDASFLPPVRPLALVRPDSAKGVAEAMRICAGHRIPVVPQGGLTGLAGGARPIEGAVALSLERFSGIEEIDPDSATVTVRAGTPLEAIQRAADDAGFFVALDLGARGSCQIGGNLATNAGGNRVIRYGMAREMVLGLEYVLPTARSSPASTRC
ncbi:FAD-binding oxidoreductase [Amaricoccus sp.]|uniref:FAD-binding oxidoreductase n=1 Tax=Amaricoccus sp. TaxID=1872485 RepID=UPI00262EDC49|nr:FAD-binding oxidoreductase [Amaricoccus sp.]HRO13424.1 FAD-binding oxidoreductase [Amaricoccus sp.]